MSTKSSDAAKYVRPTLSLKPRSHSNRRARNQFKAWCIHQLKARGANLGEYPSYADLRDAIERFGMGGR